MVYEEEFKFLNVQRVQRKEGNKFFCIVNLLDPSNNPVKFYSFDENFNNTVLSDLSNVKGLQDVLVKFELAYSNNNWNVKLLNIDFEY